MSKNRNRQSLGQELIESLEEAVQVETQSSAEMTLEESKAYRKSLHKPAPVVLDEEQKREAFRIYWAKEKSKYGESKKLENVVWLHLKATGMNSPEKFNDGIQHFGLKKIR